MLSVNRNELCLRLHAKVMAAGSDLEDVFVINLPCDESVQVQIECCTTKITCVDSNEGNQIQHTVIFESITSHDSDSGKQHTHFQDTPFDSVAQKDSETVWHGTVYMHARVNTLLESSTITCTSLPGTLQGN